MMINLSKEEAQFLVKLAAHTLLNNDTNAQLLVKIQNKLNSRGVFWDGKYLANKSYVFPNG